MDEAWEAAGTGGEADEDSTGVVYRTQRRVDMVFARLRACRDLGARTA